MMTTLLVVAGTMLVFAWGSAIVQRKQMSEGCEDGQGFYFGWDPRIRDENCVMIPVSVPASNDELQPRAQRGF